MLYENLRKRKQELGLTTEQLSRLSGVPVGTINKILNGETKSPRCTTLAALENALSDKIPGQNALYLTAQRASYIQEPVATYHAKRQGEYTLEDYYALPDDMRAELIDGVLYIMEAPTVEHQDIIMSISLEIGLFIRTNHGSCKVFTSPLDVQLNCDDKTMVQPDILVSCVKEKRSSKGIYGAPDMCIEVLSPSTRKRDLALKLQKYMEAGVREYWIIDAKQEKVICYYFESENYPVLYTFKDKVPVQIFDSKLLIDFAYVKERMEEI